MMFDLNHFIAASRSKWNSSCSWFTNSQSKVVLGCLTWIILSPQQMKQQLFLIHKLSIKSSIRMFDLNHLSPQQWNSSCSWFNNSQSKVVLGCLTWIILSPQSRSKWNSSCSWFTNSQSKVVLGCLTWIILSPQQMKQQLFLIQQLSIKSSIRMFDLNHFIAAANETAVVLDSTTLNQK